MQQVQVLDGACQECETTLRKIDEEQAVTEPPAPRLVEVTA